MKIQRSYWIYDESGLSFFATAKRTERLYLSRLLSTLRFAMVSKGTVRTVILFFTFLSRAFLTYKSNLAVWKLYVTSMFDVEPHYRHLYSHNVYTCNVHPAWHKWLTSIPVFAVFPSTVSCSSFQMPLWRRSIAKLSLLSANRIDR